MPRWQEIADDLVVRICREEWPKGGRVPSIDRLLKVYGAGRSTISQAFVALADLGLVVVRRAQYTRVAREWPTDGDQLEARLAAISRAVVAYERAGGGP
ncbi:GntR family transcriptional regulator [Acrocarpospora catenulata]|uniref:GntR family transcriptional regulator n=1 Tax=Acrocarpospora catenulata TaxID=2836182 RepID=UPI0027E09AC4|nr:GntR family transcriptional regulator [Acrocarpospora catenulata]